MQHGDRLVVINPEDEWFGTAGVMVGVRGDGFIELRPDVHPEWVLAFWPQHVELEQDVPRD